MKFKSHFLRFPRWMRDVGLFLGGITVSTVAGIVIFFWAVAGVLFHWSVENLESCSDSPEHPVLPHHNH